eukprot:5165320-Amphidinium_carterae.1
MSRSSRKHNQQHALNTSRNKEKDWCIRSVKHAHSRDVLATWLRTTIVGARKLTCTSHHVGHSSERCACHVPEPEAADASATVMLPPACDAVADDSNPTCMACSVLPSC